MQPRRGLLNGRYVGAWTHAPARDTVASGEGGYNTHSTLPMRAYTPHLPRRLQPTGIIKHARVLRGSRKNISPFASCLCLATVPRPSALFPSEPPALLIAKNHFSSVQLSSGFSSCVFSFSIFLYFFLFALCRNVFRAQAARAVQAAVSLRASVSAVNSLNQKINKLNKHRAEAGTSSPSSCHYLCLNLLLYSCRCHASLSHSVSLPLLWSLCAARPKMPGQAAPLAALVACKMPKMQQCRATKLHPRSGPFDGTVLGTAGLALFSHLQIT